MEDFSEVKVRIVEIEKRLAALESKFKKSPPADRKKISIKEFMLDKNAANDAQRTLAIGYFLEKYENLSSYNIKDLENGFRRAKENVPQNINYKVILNIKKAYMMETSDKKDNKKAWILTNTGEVFVESGFLKK